MDTAVHYKVVFSGRLRKGYAAADVKKNLAERLHLPQEKIEQLFAAGRAVLKQTPSEEEARRIVLQLAATGAIATVEPTRPPAGKKAPAAAKAKAKPKAATGEAAKPAEKKAPVKAAAKAAPAPAPAQLSKFSPLHLKLMFKPLLYLGASLEVLFTLLYAGLILGVAGGLLIPSLSSTWIGQYIGSPLLALPLQLLIAVLSTLFLLMLLKPLLALRVDYRQGIVLSEAQEPDLHAFIEDVCERIGAPMPVEIRLHNDADLRTAYHRGPLGFLQNRTVLTLGVPLIAGLNCSQLAALVARSLNRYRGKSAPRATAILLAVHAWMQRVVFEQDAVDHALLRWHQEGRLGDGMYRALQGLVVPSRKMVAARMQLSRALERRVVHRIVAESDKMALLFTGTEGFIRLLDQNSLLAFAAESQLPGLKQQWQEKGTLPDNLVQMMVLRSREYPVSMPQKLRTKQEQEKAAINDILPSDAQRLKRISHKPIHGAYYCLSPAAELFRNYNKLTHLMTLRFYHHRLQLPVSPYRLQRVTTKNSLEAMLQRTLDKRFRTLYADFLPMKLGNSMHGLDELEEAKKQWRIGLARGESEFERAQLARKRFAESEAALVDGVMREEIHLAGLWREWGEEKRKGSELEHVHQDARDAESEYEQAAHTLEHYLKANAMHLGAALAATAQAGSVLNNAAALNQEVQQLIAVLERIENVHPQLRELKMQTLLLETLLSYRTLIRQPKLDSRIEQRSADVHRLVSAIGVALKSAPYPFKDRKTEQLMSYVLHDALSDETPRGSFERGHDTIERLTLVQHRAMVRLIEIAGQVEKALGFQE